MSKSVENGVAPSRPRKKAFALAVLSACVVAVMALWFSATAVVPVWVADFDLSRARASWLTSAVQAGFVAGTHCCLCGGGQGWALPPSPAWVPADLPGSGSVSVGAPANSYGCRTGNVNCGAPVGTNWLGYARTIPGHVHYTDRCQNSFNSFSTRLKTKCSR